MASNKGGKKPRAGTTPRRGTTAPAPHPAKGVPRAPRERSPPRQSALLAGCCQRTAFVFIITTCLLLGNCVPFLAPCPLFLPALPLFMIEAHLFHPSLRGIQPPTASRRDVPTLAGLRGVAPEQPRDPGCSRMWPHNSGGEELVWRLRHSPRRPLGSHPPVPPSGRPLTPLHCRRQPSAPALWTASSSWLACRTTPSEWPACLHAI